jgi:tetratricopeptide (TPR) repeat protein
MDTATDATADGVTQPEAASVLAAGNDALERGDYPMALSYFRQVYDGPVDDEPRFQAALGIARVHAYRNELDDAEDYANHVKCETRNYAEALTLFLRVYGSDRVPATSRALHALNAAVCHLSLDDDASARPLLEYAIAHGLEDTKANAKSLIEHLDTLTEAQRLVEALDPAK